MSDIAEIELLDLPDSNPPSYEVKIKLLNNSFNSKKGIFEILTAIDIPGKKTKDLSRVRYRCELTFNQTETVLSIPHNRMQGYTYNGKEMNIKVFARLIFPEFIPDKIVIKEHDIPSLPRPEIPPEIEIKDETRSIKTDTVNHKMSFSSLGKKEKGILFGFASLFVIINAFIIFLFVSDNHFSAGINNPAEIISKVFSVLNALLVAIVYGLYKNFITDLIKFSLTPIEGEIIKYRLFKVSELFTGKTSVNLKDVTLRISAMNEEVAFYTETLYFRPMDNRGSAVHTIKNQIREIVIYEKTISYIDKRYGIENYFNDVISFEKVFQYLYPPNLISETEGLHLTWSVSLISPEYVDIHRQCMPCSFRLTDFKN